MPDPVYAAFTSDQGIHSSLPLIFLHGSPEGAVLAKEGTRAYETTRGILWLKRAGYSRNGWTVIWGAARLSKSTKAGESVVSFDFSSVVPVITDYLTTSHIKSVILQTNNLAAGQSGLGINCFSILSPTQLEVELRGEETDDDAHEVWVWLENGARSISLD